MRYRRMGATGLQLSEVALGTWATVGDRLDIDASARLLQSAYDLGVNFFDTAEVYAEGRAETTLGHVLKQSQWRRESFVVCTKVMWGTGGNQPNTWGLSRKHVIEGCNASLRRLNLDHVDVLLCHRPDPNTPVAETVDAMGTLVRAGKVLYWGTSEWPVEMIHEAIDAADRLSAPRPTIEQSQYNLFKAARVETELDGLARSGLGLCAWSPLAYGLLAGRHDTNSSAQPCRTEREDMAWLKEDVLGGGKQEQRMKIANALVKLADKSGFHPACLALAWCLGWEQLTCAITGASRPKQLQENLSGLDALGDIVQARAWIAEELASVINT